MSVYCSCTVACQVRSCGLPDRLAKSVRHLFAACEEPAGRLLVRLLLYGRCCLIARTSTDCESDERKELAGVVSFCFLPCLM